jgi:TonB family protein
VILVPERLLSMPADERRAVACHELLHVRRRDWVWILVEEHARAVFWFHPGVWWLLEQIQISREQLIDRLVVDRLSSKRAYMSALLSFADGGAVSSSTAFLRRHQLRARLRLLSQESPMSRTPLAWTAAALMLVTVAAAGAARAIPLDLPVLTAQSAPRLEIRLAETDPASGLSQAAVAGSDREIYVHASALATSADVTSAGVIEWNGTATPVTPRGSAGRAISAFAVAVRFTDTAAARLAAATGVHLGRPIAILVDGRVISAPVLRSAIGDAGVISGLSEVEARALAEALDPASSPQAPIADAGDAGIIPPRPIHEARPFYTPEAMLAGLAGSVVMSAVVDADGSVGDVVVTRSLDQKYGLDEQAVKAAKGWTFAPGTRGGVPVAVRVTLETEFTVRSSR